MMVYCSLAYTCLHLLWLPMLSPSWLSLNWKPLYLFTTSIFSTFLDPCKLSYWRWKYPNLQKPKKCEISVLLFRSVFRENENQCDIWVMDNRKINFYRRRFLGRTVYNVILHWFNWVSAAIYKSLQVQVLFTHMRLNSYIGGKVAMWGQF